MSNDEADGITLGSVLDTLRGINQRDTHRDGDVVIITDWVVKSDGRLTIPAEKREKYDIEEGDHIDGILRVEDE